MQFYYIDYNFLKYFKDRKFIIRIWNYIGYVNS